MPNEPNIKTEAASENELADEELGNVVGGVSMANEKVKKGGQKVGLVQKAHNVAQKAGLEDLRAHKQLESDDD